MKDYDKIEFKGRLYGIYCDESDVWEIAEGGPGMPDLAGSVVTDDRIRSGVIARYRYLRYELGGRQ